MWEERPPPLGRPFQVPTTFVIFIQRPGYRERLSAPALIAFSRLSKRCSYLCRSKEAEGNGCVCANRREGDWSARKSTEIYGWGCYLRTFYQVAVTALGAFDYRILSKDVGWCHRSALSRADFLGIDVWRRRCPFRLR